MPLELPGSLTPSKISSFQSCAKKFQYSVIDRLPEPPSPAATKGTLVHRALELLFWLPSPERTLEAALRALETASEEIRGMRIYTELDLSEKDEKKFFSEARVLVEKYFRIEDPATITPIGLELLVQMQFGSLTLRGIIDRLDLNPDGTYSIVDYKSGRAAGKGFEQGKLGGVHFYAFMCEQILGVRPAEIKLLHLADPIVISTRPTAQSTRGLEGRVRAVWKAVETACEREDFRPHPSRLCSWCPHQGICPAFN